MLFKAERLDKVTQELELLESDRRGGRRAGSEVGRDGVVREGCPPETSVRQRTGHQLGRRWLSLWSFQRRVKAWGQGHGCE
jgi:hypothetical protein